MGGRRKKTPKKGSKQEAVQIMKYKNNTSNGTKEIIMFSLQLQ